MFLNSHFWTTFAIFALICNFVCDAIVIYENAVEMSCPDETFNIGEFNLTLTKMTLRFSEMKIYQLDFNCARINSRHQGRYAH